MQMKDIRGVNLGGWLVLEKWISPSLFENTTAIDEHGLCTELGADAARERIRRHQQTFLEEEDLRSIKKIGLNTVRVPVGYWLFDDTDGFVGGSYIYLDKLFEWAKRQELQVILCLHGAPGSQNGWDHSGQAGAIGWGYAKGSMQRTVDFMTQLCQRYGNSSQLVGVELLNEPHPSLSVFMLARYYFEAEQVVRRYCNPFVACIVSDSFRPWLMMVGLFFYGLGRRVVLDRHLYQLFRSKDIGLDIPGHMKRAKQWSRQLKCETHFIRTIVGEWSAALPGSNHTYETYSQYAAEQVYAFERAGCGWLYWTARTEDRGPWSLLDHPKFIEKASKK